MVDLSTIQHHPAIEEISEILSNRTQNKDLPFFRILAAYFLMTTAATMRAKLDTKDRGELPINGYVVALSPSGSGKGYSIKILEDDFFTDFRRTFVDYTLPHLADINLWKLAMQRAARNGTEEQDEYNSLKKEYELTGAYIFVFDDGHPSAVKQVRQKLLLANAGSINFQVDEIGTNFSKIEETLGVFLELYDQGIVKSKLYMSTNDRKRTEAIEGKTPANLLFFGTPDKLFDGSKIEDAFYSALDTGYARRCLFAMGNPIHASTDSTPEEIYDRLCDPALTSNIQSWSHHFAGLADVNKFGFTIDVPRDVGIELITYKTDCENKADELPDHAGIRKAELAHRYFKALKLAGAFAFVEEAITLTIGHLHAAIKLVEESGQAFDAIQTREKSYMKLARYLATVGSEQTHPDLLESLPFYPKSGTPRTELMTLATAWGYKQHIVIKKTFLDGVEFFTGEMLKETDLEAVTLSHSDDWATGYTAEKAPFSQLSNLLTLPDYNWTAHTFQEGHRHTDKVLPGFNLAVFDIDGGVSLQTVHELMEDYVYLTQTTKRHTPEDNRFRLILPLNYELKLDKNDYREFMTNIVEWLPFPVDEAAAKDITKKWLTNEHARIHLNMGDDLSLLDVLPFVPKTSKNVEYRKELQQLENLDALERWFAQRMVDGNRNQHMIRFALALLDAGMDYPEIETKVMTFNAKLSNGLSSDELRRTVLATVAKKLQSAA